jgi:hypothetical protein
MYYSCLSRRILELGLYLQINCYLVCHLERPKSEEVMSSLIICTPHKILLG